MIGSWVLKTVMAWTGAIWAAFVAIHLFGNLKVFQGPEAFNSYAAWLRPAFYPVLPEGFLLWSMRIVLVIALVLHVWAAAVLWLRSRRARGRHRARLHGARSWGAWLMPLTGVLILVFIVGHVLDMTLGWTPVAPETFTQPSQSESYAYENLVASFRRPWAAWSYAAMMVLLAVHIAKGASVMASDLGVMGRRWRATFAVVGGLLAAAVLLGNAAIPIFVQLGWIP